MRLLEPVPVTGEALLLRRWTPADAGQVAEIAADPLIQLWNPVAAAAKWCADRADWSDGTHASWAVVDPGASERILGAVSLHHLDHDQSGGEVGFWVAPAVRGRGVAARALRTATAFAFGPLALRRLVLFHAVENSGSCAVARAGGFALEGVHRESYRCGDGRWHDEHSHGRLSTDPVSTDPVSAEPGSAPGARVGS